MSLTRRSFLCASAAGLGAGLLERLAAQGAAPARADWATAEAIVARIRPPRFPNRDFDITKFGARPDGTTDATEAIRRAIGACHDAGGGRVVVPSGRFATGAIHLESGVNLHVAENATLLFHRDPRAYMPVVFTRWEGVELMNFSPLVYAFGKRDIAVTGAGTLDGQASVDHWWPWKGGASKVTGQPDQLADRAELMKLATAGAAVERRVFGAGHYLRPNFIQPYRCQNVLIEDIRIVNSPMWEIHPVLCTNVTVRGVTVVTHGPNNDGCNPESCSDVLIERCTFDTGDDCIALKSGRNDDGRRVATPVQNVVVRDCVMKDGHGGVVIGSEVSGGARNVFVERCRMDSPQLDRALRFKTNSVRGGVIEHIFMRDVTVGQVAEAVVTADFFYEEGDAGKFPPTLRDVEVRNVTSKKSLHGLKLRGYSHSPITDVRIVDCTFDGITGEEVIEGVRDLVLTNVRMNGRVRNERITR